MFLTNRDFPLIHDSEIIEWDIRSANTSIMEYYGLAEQKLIDKLKELPKQEREEAVGKLHLKRKGFGKQLETGFNNIIEEFKEANGLTMDDIISIKRDAVFVKNHAIVRSSFGPVVFIPKNTYLHALLLKSYEFYVGKDTVDVKGIADEKIPLHRDGMILFAKNVLESAFNFRELNRYLKDFMVSYKRRELDFDCYREFTSDSVFRVNLGGEIMELDDIGEEEMESLDISYNYRNIVLPTLQATF